MSYPHKENIEYKGITIKVNYDQCPENPFESWDGIAPTIVIYDRSRTDYSKGQILDYLRNYLNYNQVKRNQTKLLNLMHYDVKEFREDYPLSDYDRTEMIKDDILYNWLEECISNMAQFCEAFGIKYLKQVSRGYSQGDWAELFICWTPEFGKVTGRTYEAFNQSDLKGAFDLYTNWAWGDVYWYDIEDEDGNHIDSCGGFYGDNWEENGLLEHAQPSIDSYLLNKKLTKESKLKTLIKNHVPLSKRTQILEAI